MLCSGGASEICLYDLSGKLMFVDSDPDFDSDGVFRIDLRGFVSGVYFLSAKTLSGVFFDRVMVY